VDLWSFTQRNNIAFYMLERKNKLHNCIRQLWCIFIVNFHCHLSLTFYWTALIFGSKSTAIAEISWRMRSSTASSIVPTLHFDILHRIGAPVFRISISTIILLFCPRRYFANFLAISSGMCRLQPSFNEENISLNQTYTWSARSCEEAGQAWRSMRLVLLSCWPTLNIFDNQSFSRQWSPTFSSRLKRISTPLKWKKWGFTFRTMQLLWSRTARTCMLLWLLDRAQLYMYACHTVLTQSNVVWTSVNNILLKDHLGSACAFAADAFEVCCCSAFKWQSSFETSKSWVCLKDWMCVCVCMWQYSMFNSCRPPQAAPAFLASVSSPTPPAATTGIALW